jgi:hypothetical protein
MNNSISAFDGENKFKIAGQFAQGMTRGLQGYTAALSLAGIEGEDLQKTLVKLQAVRALVNSVDGILDLKDSFSDLLRMLGIGLTSTTAQTTANATLATSTIAATRAQTAQTVAVQTTTLASKALNLA